MRSGERNSNWRGGRRVREDGYVMVYAPDHPAAVNGAVLEHRLVMERKLGRLLECGEVVHHLNGNASDNRPENLTLMTQAEHARLHYADSLAPHSYIRPPASRETRQCETCGSDYEAVGWKQRGRRFCSQSCYWLHRRTTGGALRKGVPA